MDKSILRGGIAGLLLAGLSCGAVQADVVTEKQIEQAKTAASFVKLGAKKLSAREIKTKMVGHRMTDIHGKWRGMTHANGWGESWASDLSWKDQQRWHLEGDRFCRKTEGRKLCSDVYMLGPYLRMSAAGGATLLGWTGVVK